MATSKLLIWGNFSCGSFRGTHFYAIGTPPRLPMGGPFSPQTPQGEDLCSVPVTPGQDICRPGCQVEELGRCRTCSSRLRGRRAPSMVRSGPEGRRSRPRTQNGVPAPQFAAPLRLDRTGEQHSDQQGLKLAVPSLGRNMGTSSLRDRCRHTTLRPGRSCDVTEPNSRRGGSPGLRAVPSRVAGCALVTVLQRSVVAGDCCFVDVPLQRAMPGIAVDR